jgi:hypothetical protein
MNWIIPIVARLFEVGRAIGFEIHGKLHPIVAYRLDQSELVTDSDADGD